MAIGEALETDVNGRAFEGALASNGAANVFTAVRGVNRTTQHGETVCDKAVYVTNHPIAAGPDLSHMEDNTGVSDQVITVSTTHVHLGALNANTTHVLISVEDSEIRYRSDGTDPTSAIGHRLQPRNSVVFTKARAVRCSFIRGATALVDATMHVSELIEAAILVDTGA